MGVMFKIVNNISIEMADSFFEQKLSVIFLYGETVLRHGSSLLSGWRSLPPASEANPHTDAKDS